MRYMVSITGNNCFSLHSLYPHLFSRAYINFKNPDDILLFRDRFDGYVFIDNKGMCMCLVLQQQDER